MVGTEGEGAAGAATPALSQGLGGEGMVVARGTRGRRGGDEKRVKRLGAGPVTALLASVPASGALPALVSPHPGSGICRLCHRVSPSPTRARAHASISFDLAAALLLYKPAYYILCCLYQPSKPASLENGLQDWNHSPFNICPNSPIASDRQHCPRESSRLPGVIVAAHLRTFHSQIWCTPHLKCLKDAKTRGMSDFPGSTQRGQGPREEATNVLEDHRECPEVTWW